METLTTEPQVLHFRSKFSICPAAGMNADPPMTKAFLSQADWFRSLLVRDLVTGEKLGILTDLSSQRLVLESSTPCLIEKRYHLRLSLPSVVLNRSQIMFQASCGECQEESDGVFHNTFFSPTADPGDIDALEMLIMKFAIRNLC